MRKFTAKYLISALIIVLFFIGLIGCKKDSNDKVDDDNNNDNIETSINNDHHVPTGGTIDPYEKSKIEAENDGDPESLLVGQSVNFNDVKITLNEVRIEKGGEWDESKNDHFIVLNLTAENNSDEEVRISTINVELYDDESYKYHPTHLSEGMKSTFDGAVPAGRKLRGELAFDVPHSEEYEIHYSDLIKTGKAIWIIPADDLE